MRVMATAFLVAGIMLGSAQAGLAQNASPAPMMMSKPKCAAGDPVVGVNMSTKMYMTSAQMKQKMSGMSQSQMQAMMAQKHVKMMCKSQADAMGAKPMQSSPM